MFTNISYLHIVHRIGRTGRSTNKGLATTFINKANEESVLLDLKHLLIEAKQHVPPFLATLQSETEVFQDLGGTFLDLSFDLCTELFHFLHRRQGMQLLWWSWSPYHAVSETRGGKQQTSVRSWSERLPFIFGSRLLSICYYVHTTYVFF